MRNIATILMTVLLLISTSVLAGNIEEKEAKQAQKRTDVFVEVAKANKQEQQQIYQIMLKKEQQYTAFRKDHKDDKKALKEALKPVNQVANRQIKDIIGSERMNKVHKYHKAKREANKKN